MTTTSHRVRLASICRRSLGDAPYRRDSAIILPFLSWTSNKQLRIEVFPCRNSEFHHVAFMSLKLDAFLHGCFIIWSVHSNRSHEQRFGDIVFHDFYKCHSAVKWRFCTCFLEYFSCYFKLPAQFALFHSCVSIS